MTKFKVIYSINKDKERIIQLQSDRTFKYDSFHVGNLPVDGILSGTQEWFDALALGRIPIKTITGQILGRKITGHNDFAEFEILSDGQTTSWPCMGNYDDYIVGRQIILTYTEQKLKNGHVANSIVDIQISTN